MVALIRWIGSILAIIALILIWRVHQYNVLWWVILSLFILDWMTAEAVRNSVKMGSGERIENFWTLTNMFITFAVFISSIVGIVLCGNINTKQTPEPIHQTHEFTHPILSKYFFLDEAMILLTNSHNQGSAQKYLKNTLDFKFLESEQKDEYKIDGFIGSSKNIKIGLSLFFTEDSKQLFMINIIPLSTNSDQLLQVLKEQLSILIKESLSSTDAFGGLTNEGKLYFLSSRTLNSSLILKVSVREDFSESGGAVYSINYAISEE